MPWSPPQPRSVRSSLRPPGSGATLARRLVGAVAAGALLLAGCSTSGPGPDPTPTAGSAQQAAETLAAALAHKNLSSVAFLGASGADVDAAFQPLVRGMGPLAPAVTAGPVTTSGNQATAPLHVRWTFPGVTQDWSYDTQAQLTSDGGQWKTVWQPSVLEPELDGSLRLSQRRVAAPRGELLGEDGDPIVTMRPVVRIGIDKSAVSGAQALTSARRLAKLVGVDAAGFVARVKAAGSSAFVEAIVLRATDPGRPADEKVFAIKGALPIADEQPLAPTREFARPVIGQVGEATKEIVDASGGAVVAGDLVGLSGLEQRYDGQLRGTAGVQVRLVATAAAGASPSPSPSFSPSPSGAPGTGKTVFEAKPVAGRPLTTTLNVGLQKLAEKTLAGTKPASALVAIRPSTGAVVAAASGPGSNGQSTATIAQDAPGSTFKVVSSLALLRAGLKPTSPVTCPTSVTVDGKKFTNYSDYPSGHNGTITLRTALAQSCNTAFIGQRGKLAEGDLADAAGSLGVGIDYDVGFSSFFGSVPADPSSTGRAAAMIGQGKVEASPLAMAAVVASVQKGSTVVPHLVQGHEATSKGQPLTTAEATQLRAMMRAVVTEGSGGVLDGLPGPAVIGKTGTAEFGSKAPYKTHAWMIGAQGDLAVAVFVDEGQSGSHTAGPLLRRFLAGAY